MNEYEIVFICSHKGRGEGEPAVIETTRIAGDLSRLTGYDVSPTLPSTVLVFDCPTCPRAPEVRGMRAVELYDKLLDQLRAGNRRVVVDIWMLDG